MGPAIANGEGITYGQSGAKLNGLNLNSNQVTNLIAASVTGNALDFAQAGAQLNGLNVLGGQITNVGAATGANQAIAQGQSGAQLSGLNVLSSPVTNVPAATASGQPLVYGQSGGSVNGLSLNSNQLTGVAAANAINEALVYGQTGALVNDLTVSTLVNGNCVQAGPSGLLTTVGAPCGTSSGSGNINNGTGPQLTQYAPGSGTTVNPITLSQDCTLAQGGAITCTKTNNVAFAPSATTDTTNATNITGGTLNNSRLPATISQAHIVGTTDITDSGLTNGNCVQAGVGGILTTIAGACSAGGSGTVNAGTQGHLAYYGSSAAVVSDSGSSTAHGFFLGEGTSAPSLLAPCAAGSIPYGQGASLDPVCSTLIYPNAGTTGGLLAITSTNNVGYIAAGGINKPLIGQGASTPVYAAITIPTSIAANDVEFGSSTNTMASGPLTTTLLPKYIQAVASQTAMASFGGL